MLIKRREKTRWLRNVKTVCGTSVFNLYLSGFSMNDVPD